MNNDLTQSFHNSVLALFQSLFDADSTLLVLSIN